MRVTVQLIRASDGSHLWSQTYDKTPDDVFQVQDEITADVVTALKVKLNTGATALNEPGTTNTEAYNLFLQGKFFRERINKTDSFRAVEFYQKAIQLDPNYARARVGLANVYSDQVGNGWIPRAQGIRKAREAVAQALRIDSNLPDAHRMLSHLHREFDWDWAAACTEYERARELDPGDLRDDAALAWVSEFLFGRFDNYISLARQVVARDPLDITSRSNLALGLFMAGRHEQAADAFRQAILMNPSSEGYEAMLSLTLLYLGRKEEALAAAKNESDEASRLFALPMVYWAMGRRAESDAALEENKKKFADATPENIAEVHAYRGEVDAAFEWLERAYRERDGGMQVFRVDPLLSSLRSDPRYRAMLVRMKLDGDGPDTHH